jgi:hypothetical protein
MPELWDQLQQQPVAEPPSLWPGGDRAPLRITVGGPTVKDGAQVSPGSSLDPFNPPQVEYVGKPLARTLESMISEIGRKGQGLFGHLMNAEAERTGQVPSVSTDYDPQSEAIKNTTDLASYVTMAPSVTGGVPVGALGSAAKNTLYHGSDRTNLHYINPSTRGPLGPGVYTSEAEQIAKSYAGDAGRIYEMPPVERDIYRGHGHKTDEEWFGFKADKERLVNAAAPDKKEAVRAIVDKMWSGDGYPTYQRIRSLYGGDEAAQNLYKHAGFEGVSGLVDGPETVLFGPRSQPIFGVKPTGEQRQ